MRAIMKGFVVWTLGLAVLFGSPALSLALPPPKDDPAARLTVEPPALSRLVVSPNSITGGLHATGQASLTDPVAAGASVVIALSSNWLSSSTISTSSYPVVVVPQSVTIVAGAASATFDVTTNPVPGEVRATISASYEGVTRAALMTVWQQLK